MHQRAKHVAVLMGGWSAEREISLCSGSACARALERQGFKVSCIDVGPNVIEVLLSSMPDVVFNMLHGGIGGNGTLQGALELLGIPYTHSGPAAAVLATHKDKAKAVLRQAGVPVPEGVVVPRYEVARRHVLAVPYVVKPTSAGSSLGIQFVTDEEEGPPQLPARVDWEFGEQVICETYIPGRELACGVMDGRALGVVETITTRRFNDHEEKIAPAGSRTLLPAPLPAAVYAEVQRLASQAHQALGCKGVSRADFRYNDSLPGTDGLFCLEVNNQPGMTETSLLPEMAAAEGVSFDQLVRWILDDASLMR